MLGNFLIKFAWSIHNVHKMRHSARANWNANVDQTPPAPSILFSLICCIPFVSARMEERERDGERWRTQNRWMLQSVLIEFIRVIVRIIDSVVMLFLHIFHNFIAYESASDLWFYGGGRGGDTLLCQHSSGRQTENILNSNFFMYFTVCRGCNDNRHRN